MYYQRIDIKKKYKYYILDLLFAKGILTTFRKGYNEVSAKWIQFGITFLTEGYKGYLKCITNG